MQAECFVEECLWDGDLSEADHTPGDPEDFRCPRCFTRLTLPETVGEKP